MEILQKYFEKNKKKSIKNLIPNINDKLYDFFWYYQKFLDKKEVPINVFITSNGYTRNVMFRNENYEVIIIKWSKGVSSPIHDHANRGCCMVMLDGELIETRYKIISKELETSMVTSVQNVKKYNVSFIENKEGIHKIENKSNDDAFSLHIYSPPLHKAKYFKEDNS